MKQRVTITLDEEVLSQYKELAHEGRTNLSKCINDWLAETAPALAQVTDLLRRAKEAPQRVVAELAVFSEMMGGELDTMTAQLHAMAGENGSPPAAGSEDGPTISTARSQQNSPHSNTGLKPPFGNF